ncbi:MAG: orotidine 5'-phosphate decarboxylase, partial [Halobacteria archaeon]|nr:orotidine 5'-phosphate decarboxylase [Halobacteria archaeon]
KTTNDGSADFQDLEVAGEKPLYLHVAERAAEWNYNDNVGLVVGATHPEDMEEVRQHAAELPFLVPGVGAQGGSVEAAVEHGTNFDGVGVVNSTRSIIYAGEGEDENFDKAARESAKSLKRNLNEYR